MRYRLKVMLTDYSENVIELSLTFIVQLMYHNERRDACMSEQINEQSMSQENAALRSRVSVLEEELALAQQQLEWFRKQIFGRKTEQTSVILDGGEQLSMFPENTEQAV